VHLQHHEQAENIQPYVCGSRVTKIRTLAGGHRDFIYCPNGVFNLGGLQEKQIEMNREQTLILDKRADYPIDKNFMIPAVSPDMVAVIIKITDM
jgi:hypothetical protein